ncbi:MAG: hypothetical protein SCH70_14355 [Candidatus Methanoperedens sp.]|nr:hypothetical protein [Candidatus Methanoperedens sp.]
MKTINIHKEGHKMQTSQKYRKELLNEIKDLSDEQVANLMKIIHIFKESINYQREDDFNLKKEFDEWDSISDDDLINFEDTL